MGLLKENWQDYVRSSFITFLAGVAFEIAPLLDNITLHDVQDGAILGILFVAVRGGIRAVVQAFIGWYSKS